MQAKIETAFLLPDYDRKCMESMERTQQNTDFFSVCKDLGKVFAVCLWSCISNSPLESLVVGKLIKLWMDWPDFPIGAASFNYILPNCLTWINSPPSRSDLLKFGQSWLRENMGKHFLHSLLLTEAIIINLEQPGYKWVVMSMSTESKLSKHSMSH